MRKNLFLKLNSKLEPIQTGLDPFLPKIENIKAVIFDIYGTLVISRTGDISMAQKIDREAELRSILKNQGISLRNETASISQAFYGEIKADHSKSRGKGHQYPEVDILEIWRRCFETQVRHGNLDGLPDPELIREIAVRYECAVNPVWPMYGLTALIFEKKLRQLPLGIVSNAQFYTPTMLQAFTGKTLSQMGFHQDLCIWSYQERLGKPAVELFEKLLQSLKARNVSPQSALYVGNDMLNDVWAASQVGLKTALFAGDQRSLRLRETDARCRSLKPDAVVTALAQIPDLLE